MTRTMLSAAMAASVLALTASATPASAADERVLGTTKDGAKIVVSGKAWCGERVSLRVDAPSPTFFSGERLTQAVGTARLAVSFECPKAQAIQVTGRSAGQTVFEGAMSAADAWALTASRSPDGGVQTAAAPTAPEPKGTETKVVETPPAKAPPPKTEEAAAPSAGKPPGPAPAEAPAKDGAPAAAAASVVQESPAPASVDKVRAAAMDWQTLFEQWLAANPDQRKDMKFADSYTRHFECFAYRQVRDNDFRRDEVLEQGRAKAAALPLAPKTNMVLRINSEFGKYDFDRKEFAFVPLNEGTYFPVDKPQSIQAKQGWDNCFPADTAGLPQRFKVEITNPEVMVGLPMDKAKADALIAARTDSHGWINRSVVVSMTLAIDVFEKGEIRDDDRLLLNGEAVPVKARIVAASVEDGGKPPKTLYTLDPNRMTAKMALADANRERAQADEAAAKAERKKAVDVDFMTLDHTFTRLTSGKPITDESPQRVVLEVSMCKGKTEGVGDKARTTTDRLEQLGGMDTPWRIRSNDATLKFANVQAFENIPLPEEAKGELKTSSCLRANGEVVYAPVGVDNDKFKGGKSVIGHILYVDFPWTVKGQKVKWRIAAPGEGPKPWSRSEDPRTARDFDVIGVKGGMTLDEVKAIAEKELAQTLTWAPGSKRLTSPSDQCSFGKSTGSLGMYGAERAPHKIGQRCFEATFVEEDGKTVLATLSLRQVLPGNKAQPVTEAIKAKYGAPIYKITDHSNSDVTAYRGYGRRWSDDRLDGRNVQSPQFALEMDGSAFNDNDGPVYVLGSYLTDQILRDRKVQAEEKARKEKEEKAKVDVKL
ncbi:DUF4852 domain-containing protein [Azospirillum soli]|uniref:DUF4852 domain-containing protein n=1 Tax=Azospirillum soli TaxID=1304799 RepID=UPI001AEA9813|nr:DUF4852 domain-containing protein [Azospirillum soli]MBP2315553.1 hypothetical protein [Azospirillum soli]